MSTLSTRRVVVLFWRDLGPGPACAVRALPAEQRARRPAQLARHWELITCRIFDGGPWCCAHVVLLHVVLLHARRRVCGRLTFAASHLHAFAIAEGHDAVARGSFDRAHSHGRAPARPQRKRQHCRQGAWLCTLGGIRGLGPFVTVHAVPAKQRERRPAQLARHSKRIACCCLMRTMALGACCAAARAAQGVWAPDVCGIKPARFC